ncbi:MAG: tRNA dihydrouridine(20/20a) synthase DusA [Betaproteobacteria bacterium]|nr:tRNA dihydrouridine(20/20a) synthase DusA [Betaproteobacteria bacterium]
MTLPDADTGWRFCVAPMLDWTDRHCRGFHRSLSAHARLYTEMITTGALIHGDADRLLAFDPAEHPVALQLGGSEPDELARCARLAERHGYDEINLNCGCPSERVQRGAFGACLMAEPALVRDCVAAMRDAVSVPVTVKHRIGIDREESYDFVRDFVGEVARGGVRVFIVHARNAWLKGLSPRQNREVPPLRPAFVHRLKRDFPELRFVLNGGIASLSEALAPLAVPGCADGPALDGVMLGREAYGNPWLLAGVDPAFFGKPAPLADRHAAARQLAAQARTHVAAGGRVRDVARHALGLFNGLPGARRWRRLLSDAAQLAVNDPGLVERAAAEVAAPDPAGDDQLASLRSSASRPSAVAITISTSPGTIA